MSYIQNTIRCKYCLYEMNVALGTFGTGVPKNCPECQASGDYTEKIADGWHANENDRD